MRTAQEIFDISATHLLTQMKRSEAEDGRCKYRGPNGLKCAIGPLIPDEKYKTSFEGDTVTGNHRIVEAAGIPISAFQLASTLQRIHDGYTPEEWRKELVTVSESYNLKLPAIFTEAKS